MFGLGLARNLGVGVGDRVVVLVTQASGGINAVELTVRGIFSTSSKAYDDAALRMPIDTARKVLRAAGAHSWITLLEDTERTDDFVAALRSRFPPKEFQIVPWHQLADFYNKTVSLFSKQVDVVRAIIAAIIVLGITNTMMMSVMERTGEIGTAMALGANRRRVLGHFLVEGALLGVVGGILGVVVGWLLALLISNIGIPMPAPPGMAHGFIGRDPRHAAARGRGACAGGRHDSAGQHLSGVESVAADDRRRAAPQPLTARHVRTSPCATSSGTRRAPLSRSLRSRSASPG